MKVCVFGAGAIGGLMAARIAMTSPAEVSVVARGAHLQAIQEKGLRLQSGAQHDVVAVRAASEASQLGKQDVVIVALKTCSLPAAASSILPLLSPDTVIVPAMNGIPWWFFSGFGGALENMRLEGADPGGIVSHTLPREQVLGCVVYSTAYLGAPGVVCHTGRWDLFLGEPNGIASTRQQRVQRLLAEAGFDCRTTANIRTEIWAKLLGNVAFNTVAALSNATLDRIIADPDTASLLMGLMNETIAVGHALGLDTGEVPAQRLEKASRIGATRPSMLQDLEAGRPTEHESLTGAVLQIGKRLGVSTPLVSAVHGLIRLRSGAGA